MGFEPDHLLTAAVNLPAAKYETSEKTQNFFETLFSEIQAVPGVVSAGVTSGVPMGGRGNTGMSIVPTPRPEDIPRQGVQAPWRMATADYLRTMKVPLKLGRLFDASDALRPGVIPQRPAIILSERLVRTLWSDGSNPVGRQVILANGALHIKSL